MITVYPHKDLGHANHGWLDARHHFSFAHYYNPKRLGFGVLRVINDDTIAAGSGFDTHPHKDMEIITYVRQGAITHRDSQGNEGRTKAGDVQVMSAGRGVFHSEFNLEDEDTKIFQIWIEPNKIGVTPSWDAHAFPKETSETKLDLLVSGDGNAPLFIHQDAFIYAGHLKQGAKVMHPIKHQAYVVVSSGEVEINGHALNTGDGAEIIDLDAVEIHALAESKILVIDVPAKQTTH